MLVRNSLLGLFGLATALTVFSLLMWAQESSAPPAYTVTQVVSMFGPAVNQIVYRSGSKALVDQTSGSGTHTRTLYDLQAHTSTTWDLANAAGGCSVANFSGDWGNRHSRRPTIWPSRI